MLEVLGELTRCVATLVGLGYVYLVVYIFLPYPAALA